MVAWRIMSLIRQRGIDKVAVIIPQSAFSAATLVAFGADEIVMHPNGHLGPVDLQITTWGEGGQPKRFSTEDISAFLEFVRENLKITDQQHIRALFELTCKEVGTLGIGFTARSSKLAVDLGERLLALHMKGEEAKTKIKSIVSHMSTKFYSHALPVSRTDPASIGLPVNKERDRELEKLMWAVYLHVAEELQEHTPFDPLMELLKSTKAKKLLAPVLQFAIPYGATQTTNWTTRMQNVVHKGKERIEPGG